MNGGSILRLNQHIVFLQGGDGYQHQKLNHPLYITSNREGGYGTKETEYERGLETIYAGVESEYGMVRNHNFFNLNFQCDFIAIEQSLDMQ